MGQPLQAGRDIDPVAVDAIPIGDHIPQIDADTENHFAIIGKRGIGVLDVILNRQGALHRIHRAGKF
ncbi:MAG: hypothetical protein QNJ01_04480, partial [Desulfobacterales bacterium]|nr:hypothetical protein [Desulfobacterales bacterium]